MSTTPALVPPRVSAEFFESRPFPELLALDIDDTLVTHLGAVSERVVDAVGRAVDAGINVVLSTGRTISTTAPIARALGLDGWAVCSNGAMLAMVEPETIVDTVTFDPRTVLDRLVTLLPGGRCARSPSSTCSTSRSSAWSSAATSTSRQASARSSSKWDCIR